jgi:NNP family nitrate/nitrite transporter-like MFS transporter
MQDAYPSNLRWYMLALLTATGTFVSAIPFSCMPVLFKEISEDLGLSLVQIGTIWGTASLAGVFVSLIAGVMSDRFGVKLFLSVSCILVGVTGALRGLSNSFLTLMVTVFINGIVRLMIPINVTKTVGMWFKGQNLGMAMGIAAMGMGLGLMLGPMISATTLSPLLGGWRNVMYLYGAISIIVGILWFLFGREPRQVETSAEYSSRVPIRQAFSRLIHLKALWLMGFTLLFRSSGIMGMTGYLPLYLRGQGWPAAGADGTLATFYAVSTICVVPLSLLSDKLGSRKVILFPALIVTFICMSLIPVVNGVTIWVLIALSGVFMDSYMAITTTMLMETEGVGPVYSGTALGIVFTIAQIGSVISPPLGNSFASISPGLPFVFWAVLSGLALVPLALSKDTGLRKTHVN